MWGYTPEKHCDSQNQALWDINGNETMAAVEKKSRPTVCQKEILKQ
jgi:hypothetical protein